MDGVRAGDPVEEQQAVAVVDLVLEGAGLEGVGRERRPPRRVPGSWPRTTSRVARFTSPVRSGTLMQPSRAFSLRLASTTSALHSTKVPWWSRVLGCAETSTQNTWTPDPDLRRGQADAARRDPHRGDQVGGELDDVGARSGRPGRRRSRAPGRERVRRRGRRPSTPSSASVQAAHALGRVVTARRPPPGRSVAPTPSCVGRRRRAPPRARRRRPPPGRSTSATSR